MAVLLIDAGNSRLKWTLLDAGRLGPPRAQPWHALPTPPSEWRALPAPERVVAASVAGGEREGLLRQWCVAQWGYAPEFLRAGAQAGGVRNAYRRPERLGVDRWAALVAARRSVAQAPVCVLDCGSAVTVDVLDAAGRHRGGWIVPGLSAQRSLLLHATRALGLGDAAGDQALAGEAELALGCSTEEALEWGSRAAIVALAHEARAAAQRLCGAPAAGFLCGGDAPRLRPALEADWRYRPLLVLAGAALLAGESVEESEW